MGNTHNLFIDKFSLQKLKQNPKILIIGKTRSGKTTMCHKIIKYLNSIGFTEGEIINPSDKMLHFSKNNKINIQFENKSEIIEDLLLGNKYVVFDECFPKQHDGINIECLNFPLIVVQKKCKDNIFDYIFIFKNHYTRQIYDMVKKYFNNYKQFLQYYSLYTKNYKCIVIDKNCNKIFWYKD